MDLFSNLSLGFSVATSLANLAYCFLGVTLGTFIGVLPGVGPLVTISLLLPLTYGLPATGALIMLAGIYYGAAYGGSTTAILVNLPGESSSVMTCIDGHQMAKQGRAGAALAIAALSSFAAGCVGTLLIAMFGPLLSSVALDFRAPEYFSLMLMALVLAAALSHGAILKGVAMSLLGVLGGLVGTDVNSGTQRFSFGVPGLYEGIDFVVVAMGLFALGEIICNLEKGIDREQITGKITRLMPTVADLKDAVAPTMRGTLVGSFLGVLPGAGPTISSFAAYMLEKRVNRHPEQLGHGAVAGVAAPESANNAASQTAFIPTLTLGIPGSGTMALMLGAMLIQGITPGPQVMTEQPKLFWGLVVSMWIGNLMLVILNLPLVGVWVRILKIPYRWLYPTILVFSCVGVFSVNTTSIDLYILGLFGLLGYLFSKLNIAPAPFILGFVLGPMLEENLRRAMLLSRGDVSIFVTHPISAAFLALTVLLLIAMISPAIRKRKDQAAEEAD